MEGEGFQGISEHVGELVRAAKEAFDGHKFEGCLSALNRLLDVRRHDARVAHNRAVAQYLLSNLTSTDEFRKTLQTLSLQFERDAESSGIELSISDKGVLYFNQALIHMRLHQNTQAITMLEGLFKVRNALGESLTVEVNLLLIELYISTHRFDKAAVQITCLEQQLYNGPLVGGNNGRGDFENQQGGSEGMRCRPRLHLVKARLHLLHMNIKACKKELKNYTGISGNTPCTQFLKANVEYLRHNYHKALKVLSSAPKSSLVTDAGECLSTFYFNNFGCLHFQLGKCHLAAHYFRKAIDENDAALNGFPPLDRATPLSGRPLSVLGVNCRHVLLYNLGLQQLYGGQPLPAFDSLLEVVQVYHANPRLWLRLAEACIAAHSMIQKELLLDSYKTSELVTEVFGQGLHHKLAVAPIQHWVKKGSLESHTQSAAMPAPTLEFAAICLKNALFLLPPTSAFLASTGLTPIDEVEGEGSPSSLLPSCPALPGPPIQGDQILSLRAAVLLCLAYVSLGLGDSVSVLSYTQQLFDMPKLSGGFQYLGQLYTAEALVHLDRISEAMQYLNPEAIGDITVHLNSANADHSDNSDGNHSEQQPAIRPTTALPRDDVLSFPKTVQTARAVMFFNLASMFCLRKETDKARKALQQAASLFGANSPRQVILLSAYIELVSGNVSQAIQVIKKNQPFPTALFADKKKARRPSYLSYRQL